MKHHLVCSVRVILSMSLLALGSLVNHLINSFSGGVSCIINPINISIMETKLSVLDWC